jgi:hypothetical protein
VRQRLRYIAGILLGSGLLLLVGAFPFAASAQRAPAPYRIGVLNDARAANHPTVDGLKAGLRALGFEKAATSSSRSSLPMEAPSGCSPRPQSW